MSRAPTVALLVWLCACSSSSADASTPRACKLDDDCGKGAYCTAANVCRTDCFDDVDCFGATTEVQCNVHGQCIDTSGDTGPLPDVPVDETSGDAKDDATHDGPPPDIIDPEIGP